MNNTTDSPAVPAFDHLIPPDKPIGAKAIEALVDRGVPPTYAGNDLTYIGMPVGGGCAGHLYLGGDGKLWLWDIFNIPRSTFGEHYANPKLPYSPVDQGFAIVVESAMGDRSFPLDRTGNSRHVDTGVD